MIAIILISEVFFRVLGVPIGTSSNVKTRSTKTERAFVHKLPEKAINAKGQCIMTHKLAL